MNRNKKNLHKKVTANVLGLTLASVVAERQRQKRKQTAVQRKMQFPRWKKL